MIQQSIENILILFSQLADPINLEKNCFIVKWRHLRFPVSDGKKTEGTTATNGACEKNAGNKKAELAPEGIVSKATLAGKNTSSPLNIGGN